MNRSEITREGFKRLVEDRASSLFCVFTTQPYILGDLLCEGTVTKHELTFWFKEALDKEFPTNE